MTGYRLAHIGYVVDNMANGIQAFESEGGTLIMEPIRDPIQKVCVCLIKMKEDESLIELVSPGGFVNTPIKSRLERGGGLDHLCYFTNDLKSTLESEDKAGSILVCPPVFSTAFNSLIAFVYRRSGLLVEYLLTDTQYEHVHHKEQYE